MILKEIKEIKSGTRELRQFGIVMAVACGLVGGWALWRGRPFGAWLLGIGVILLLLGLACPVVLKPLQKVWMTLAVMMGFVMTRVILAALFYLVITPIGFVAKLFGKSFLDSTLKRGTSESYWIPRKQGPLDKASYERQF